MVSGLARRPGQAKQYYIKAGSLDPNNYEVLNRIGLHYVHNAQFASARPYFRAIAPPDVERQPNSRQLPGYLPGRMLENATNDLAGVLPCRWQNDSGLEIWPDPCSLDPTICGTKILEKSAE